MSNVFTLDAESLFDKFGFGDGDMLSDVLFDNNIDPDLGEGEWDSKDHTLEDRLLLMLVEKHLLPAIPEKLEPRLWWSCHNPVRCEDWGHGMILTSPEWCRDIAVEVPEAEVLEMARQLEQTIKAELAERGTQ